MSIRGRIGRCIGVGASRFDTTLIKERLPPRIETTLTNTQQNTDRSWIRGSLLRDVILGWQDGIVSVLGITLGVATATASVRLVLISGLASLFAEAASMAAVAYTSSKAARDYYYKQLRREEREVEEIPDSEVQEIRDIYHRKGFRDKDLEQIVVTITSDKKLWVETMMAEELRLFPEEYQSPGKSSIIVGVSDAIGSFIPLLPFTFMSLQTAVITSIVVSVILLFATGSMKARLTIGDWRKSGVEMALVGSAAAVFGYIIGTLLGMNVT